MLLILIAIVSVVGILSGCDTNQKPYEDAQALLDSGYYSEAAVAFETLGEYEDAATKAKYASAQALLIEDKYTEAAVAFESLGEYADSKELARTSKIASSEAYVHEKYQHYPQLTDEENKSGIVFSSDMFSNNIIVEFKGSNWNVRDERNINAAAAGFSVKDVFSGDDVPHRL